MESPTHNPFSDEDEVYLSRSALQDTLETRLGAEHAHYYSEYGVNADTSSVTVHIFANRDHFTALLEGKLARGISVWDPGRKEPYGGMECWGPKHLEVHANLERGLDFLKEKVKGTTCSYEPELQTYTFILPEIGRSLDPTYFVNAFFALVNQGLSESDTGSGTPQ